MRSPTPFDTQALRDHSPPSIDALSTLIGREARRRARNKLLNVAIMHPRARFHQPVAIVRPRARQYATFQLRINRPRDDRLLQLDAFESDFARANAVSFNLASMTRVTADCFNSTRSVSVYRSDPERADVLPRHQPHHSPRALRLLQPDSSDLARANALPFNVASITHVAADNFAFAVSFNYTDLQFQPHAACANALPLNQPSIAHVTADPFNPTSSNR
ncbi:hypothetical protein FB451DRAFT_1572276 [Mycena latifolia]|nr:hypothetical protein FB451DRAFT_1572276 [Mycena latifolia]